MLCERRCIMWGTNYYKALLMGQLARDKGIDPVEAIKEIDRYTAEIFLYPFMFCYNKLVLFLRKLMCK